MRKLIIVAGTGFLGHVLVDHFKNKFEEIVILTRGNSKTIDGIRYVNWDARTLSGWEKELENATVLINLAGKSVDCRYTKENKKEILLSRIESTKILNQAVLKCQNPPKHWLNSSTSTIYRFSLDKQMDEVDGETGNDFSMNVALSWEKAFFKTETPNTLKTALRTSIVLGKKGGAFVPLKTLAKLGFGGKQGKGNQFISWIHEDDFANAVEFILQKEITGRINIVSPQPIRNSEFMKQLRTAVGAPFGIPISTFLLEMGSFIIRTETELVLKSRNVIPRRLLENGFKFQFENIGNTFKNLLNK
ncbi:TIGR01777 family oxidoreductase [Flavobacterium sp. Fl-77]|uniref:TIGR01777 family oxidoreductase n=1 Tax=Flavobacterium flavipigmentatum TaxID=2893884 RepID=A0AAJ2S8S8_9FLAO|nr:MULTISPECIES: TIGR01777 family oxidoreductase [unclassified Flavobacterium]MDX6182111.1 TIGR01777 family oxidoreductase [Flavobacterium sp. Fl-33]MDX6185976.1 TIGR01777 family oxidoreductase [Flavobacterium sp. Fl-77]UFH39151.1 TIGR01777 family oxidoreductase [Flavobacterium sp. F-70]